MHRSKEIANNSFFKREYNKALFHYSLALKEEPLDKEARLGVLLCDMAFDKEDEAVALFEFYEATKDSKDMDVYETMEEIIDYVDQESDNFFALMDSVENQIFSIKDGIEYKDFIELVERKNSFKIAMQDLMFSSKIIIYKKDDFIDFINLLISNDFRELALNYIETALNHYPKEIFFHKKLNQLENIEI